MKCASNKRRSRGLGCAGVTSLEFAIVALGFFLILLSVGDLGRYFLTAHSLRTLTSELARATLIGCASLAPNGTYNLPSSGTESVATAEVAVPFLLAANFTSGPSASCSKNASGAATITASASYNFTFVLPIFASASGPISSSTTMQSY